MGCDVYIEASGSQASVSQGLSALKNLGRYVQMGVFADEVKADWNVIGDGKSGFIKTEGLISHSFLLKDWEKAFETEEKAEDAMKVMLVAKSRKRKNSGACAAILTK